MPQMKAGRRFDVARNAASGHNMRMFFQSTETTVAACRLTAVMIVIAGVTADMLFAILFQARRIRPVLSSCRLLRERGYGVSHAQLALSVTLLFALPYLFQKPDSSAPKVSSLVFGQLLYAFTALSAILLCLVNMQKPFRALFMNEACGTAKAFYKGLFYGIAAIPPVMLLSFAANTVTSLLGYESSPQDVFRWLEQDALHTGARYFTLAAIVLLAPVIEEFLFRGILLPCILKGRSFLFAALLSGAYFATVHFHAPSFIPLLSLSIVFAAGYAATGSIITPIVMHALFNLSGLVFYAAGM